MREYKFRGKRKDNREWVYGYYSKRYRRSNGGIYHYISTGDIECFCGTFPVDPATVGQYTGLRDCKRTAEYPEGQEIYGGDIVSLPDMPCPFQVIFNDGAFEITDGHCTANLRGYLHELKVIGSIHDNPLG